MSSILNSQGFLATAMASVSVTVILLALCLQKSPPSPPTPRSCILSDEKRVSEKKHNKAAKTKKKVHFADDVVDPTGYSDEFKRQHGIVTSRSSSSNKQQKSKTRSMPANRMALYNGILRDRVGQRLAYSY